MTTATNGSVKTTVVRNESLRGYIRGFVLTKQRLWQDRWLLLIALLLFLVGAFVVRIEEERTSYRCPGGLPQVSDQEEPTCLWIEYDKSNPTTSNANRKYGVEGAVGRGPFCLQQTSSHDHNHNLEFVPYSRNFCYPAWRRIGDSMVIPSLESVRLWATCDIREETLQKQNEKRSSIQKRTTSASCSDDGITWYVARDFPSSSSRSRTTNSSSTTANSPSLDEVIVFPPMGAHSWQMTILAPQIIAHPHQFQSDRERRTNPDLYRSVPLKVSTCEPKDCLSTAHVRKHTSVGLWLLLIGVQRIPLWIAATMVDVKWNLQSRPLVLVGVFLLEGVCLYHLIQTCATMATRLLHCTAYTLFFWIAFLVCVVDICRYVFALIRRPRVMGRILPNDDGDDDGEDKNNDNHNENPSTIKRSSRNGTTPKSSVLYRWVEFRLPRTATAENGGSGNRGIEAKAPTPSSNPSSLSLSLLDPENRAASKNDFVTNDGGHARIFDSEQQEPLMRRQMLIYPVGRLIFPVGRLIFPVRKKVSVNTVAENKTNNIGNENFTNSDNDNVELVVNHDKVKTVMEVKVMICVLVLRLCLCCLCAVVFMILLDDGMDDQLKLGERRFNGPWNSACDVWFSSPFLRPAFWTLALVPGLLHVVTYDHKQFGFSPEYCAAVRDKGA